MKDKGFFQERRIFNENLSQWQQEKYGQWVWIQGTDVKFFDSYEEAISAAHAMGLTNEALFIEEIAHPEDVRLVAGIHF